MGQRLLTHESMTLSRQELETYWSLDDVFEQHHVLDEIDAARARAAKRVNDDG